MPRFSMYSLVDPSVNLPEPQGSVTFQVNDRINRVGTSFVVYTNVPTPVSTTYLHWSLCRQAEELKTCFAYADWWFCLTWTHKKIPDALSQVPQCSDFLNYLAGCNVDQPEFLGTRRSDSGRGTRPQIYLNERHWATLHKDGACRTGTGSVQGSRLE